MLAARMYGYNKPLVLEDIKVPEISPDQVLVRVGGAGMCRSDVQLIDGYFEVALKPNFPITPGHANIRRAAHCDRPIVRCLEKFLDRLGRRLDVDLLVSA